MASRAFTAALHRRRGKSLALTGGSVKARSGVVRAACYRAHLIGAPPMDPLRSFERIHGHLGWLVAIALVHPAVLLRRTKRKAHLSVALAVAMVTAVFVIGVGIYGDYRDKLRQQIFIHSKPIGYLFERKEHLAFGALLLAWAGAVSYAAATRVEGEARESLRRASHWAFVAAAILALATASFGIVIAAYKSF